MSGGRGASESVVWRKGVARVHVGASQYYVCRCGLLLPGEMSHPQSKFRILSVEILSQQRDIQLHVGAFSTLQCH